MPAAVAVMELILTVADEEKRGVRQKRVLLDEADEEWLGLAEAEAEAECFDALEADKSLCVESNEE